VAKSTANDGWRFAGFTHPNYTQVPDEFFDDVAPRLTEAELRVALYLIRRTFGFKKDADAVSIKQMVDGITTREGEVLDRGTGMHRSSVVRGCQGLVAKGVIDVCKERSSDGDYEANVYALRFADETGGRFRRQGKSRKATTPARAKRPPVVAQSDPQETGQQQTADKKDDIAPRRLTLEEIESGCLV
jgi:Bacteriophage replication protein O